jgi:DamX protein
MSQPAENYTIQIVASGNEAAVRRFITEHNLQDAAAYYRSQRNGSNWFTVILGSFETLSQAKSALSKLDSSLQMAKPWIKPVAQVQEALAARNSE